MNAADEPTEELDEPVHITAWDPRWPALARVICAELARRIGQDRLIEHIGSTALEGMPSKPIIDLMIGALDEREQDAFARRLSEAGWQDMGEAGVPGRRHLRNRKGQHANVHIVCVGSSHWRNNLAIRSYLSAHAAERAAYAAAKRSALAVGARTLLPYSDRKADFMSGLLQRATDWRSPCGNGR